VSLVVLSTLQVSADSDKGSPVVEVDGDVDPLGDELAAPASLRRTDA
jgi:hypothetical protein